MGSRLNWWSSFLCGSPASTSKRGRYRRLAGTTSARAVGGGQGADTGRQLRRPSALRPSSAHRLRCLLACSRVCALLTLLVQAIEVVAFNLVLLVVAGFDVSVALVVVGLLVPPTLLCRRICGAARLVLLAPVVGQSFCCATFICSALIITALLLTALFVAALGLAPLIVKTLLVLPALLVKTSLVVKPSLIVVHLLGATRSAAVLLKRVHFCLPHSRAGGSPRRLPPHTVNPCVSFVRTPNRSGTAAILASQTVVIR